MGKQSIDMRWRRHSQRPFFLSPPQTTTAHSTPSAEESESVAVAASGALPRAWDFSIRSANSSWLGDTLWRSVAIGDGGTGGSGPEEENEEDMVTVVTVVAMVVTVNGPPSAQRTC
ncbi:uncharacterized protein N7482_007494 [Penicillium canariense]|uniref:Uncharacterized protein n=1 Tax=Penicillium canariense TaxID=189055 RepID=A0A9W9LJW8_9EURO|nr:uncharacterized protein N7482_007494 [Penicillium canariense]KAJ5160490.1 hypothetical protein N7482_007494 [Penicillium canariense]